MYGWIGKKIVLYPYSIVITKVYRSNMSFSYVFLPCFIFRLYELVVTEQSRCLKGVATVLNMLISISKQYHNIIVASVKLSRLLFDMLLLISLHYVGGECLPVLYDLIEGRTWNALYRFPLLRSMACEHYVTMFICNNKLLKC